MPIATIIALIEAAAQVTPEIISAAETVIAAFRGHTPEQSANVVASASKVLGINIANGEPITE